MGLTFNHHLKSPSKPLGCIVITTLTQRKNKTRPTLVSTESGTEFGHSQVDFTNIWGLACKLGELLHSLVKQQSDLVVLKESSLCKMVLSTKLLSVTCSLMEETLRSRRHHSLGPNADQRAEFQRWWMSDNFRYRGSN